VLHLDRAAVAARLDRHALLERLRRAFASDCTTPVRQSYAVGGDGAGKTLLLMPAWRADGSLGVKLVTVVADNAVRSLPAVHACYLLFDANTGMPRALLDGTELTLRRTGAASALAATYLARSDATRLLMVGTGALATHVVLSHAGVRPISAVRIWGRRVEKAREVVAALEAIAGQGFSVELCDDLLRGFEPRLTPVKCGNITELTAIRAAARELDTANKIAPALDQPIGWDREIGEGQAFVGGKAALPRGWLYVLVDGTDQRVSRVADLAEVKIIEFRILLRRG